jgi:DeoR/GlpR family transcriptional regulator of sugar metabolism
MAIEARDHDLDFDWQSARMAEEKKRIAAIAAHLVEDGQTVILDGGSTVAAVARSLKNHSLHIVTNSLPIAEVFHESREVEVTLTGGYLYPRLRVMLGPLCEQMLGSVTADVLVMGIGGATEAGFSNNNALVVSHQRKMIEAARKVIIVADHTKFGRGAVIYLAPLDIADIVVSDIALAPGYQDLLHSYGAEVLLA